VRKSETNQLLAHAWLMSEEYFVVAGRNQKLGDYKIVNVFVSKNRAEQDVV